MPTCWNWIRANPGNNLINTAVCDGCEVRSITKSVVYLKELPVAGSTWFFLAYPTAAPLMSMPHPIFLTFWNFRKFCIAGPIWKNCKTVRGRYVWQFFRVGKNYQNFTFPVNFSVLLGAPAKFSQHVHLIEADLEIMPNSVRALCLAFFSGQKKISYFHFFRLGSPARSSQHVHLREADLEIMQNSAQALCLAFFSGRKKISYFHLFRLGTPARSSQHVHLREADLEIMQNSAQALCLAFFFGSEKFSYLHFFCQIVTTIGDPGARKVFATPPPQRIRFGNHSKNGAWWVSTYLPWTFFSSWSNLAVFPDFTSVHPDTLLQAWAAPLLLRAEAVPP